MKKQLKNWGRRAAALFLAAFLAAAPVIAAAAPGEDEARVLRVPFPQVPGLTETAQDGSRRGLVVDYLNEIAKYTGWQYEYVDTDGDSMVGDFLDGAYDLMGGTYYSPGFEVYFAYPDYNIGYSRSVLMARLDDESVSSYDLRSLNGKTIGVYERALENIRRLREFLSMHDLDCEIRTYSFEQLGENGKLYPYLENGEVDLLLGNGFEDPQQFRIVTSFESQPYYIVAHPGDQEILDGLNMALKKIADSNPNFSAQQYAAHFQNERAVDIRLSAAEQEYVQGRGAVTVAIPESYHPLVCLNSPDGEHSGVVPDILDRVAEFTGLTFTYIQTDTYSEAVRMVQQGEAELLGFYMGDEDESARQGLALTAPYADMNNIVVRNKGSSYPAEGLVGAVAADRTLPAGIEAAEVRTYPTVTQALEAVNAGRADFIYGLASRLELDIQRYHFSNLVPVTLVNDRSDLAFALRRPCDPDLLTILNKAVNSLTAQERALILDRNVISIGASGLSLLELINANPVTFIAVLTLFLLMVVTAVLMVSRAKMRSAVMQSELEKAEAESRAKGEFLSRMSHELRTPMNAVVGLTDLTDMMEGVPPGVRQNLSKLRAASHYMLDLINDVLDMSRIDSGKLSLSSEPFSLEGMLDGIQSMMEAEAHRRGLTYTVEKEIVHSDLTGDGIRLRQVLTNLLSNAFKFTPEGGSVRLQVTEQAGDGGQAVFTFRVTDTGIGIEPGDHKRIFESFEQVGPSRAKSQGTGLGLPISRSIVQMMGGELQVDSSPGRGSEFWFTVALPLGCPGRDDADGPDRRRPEEQLLDGVTILLAEDNDLNAEIAAQLLELQGAQVCRCENGRQAVDQFAGSGPGAFQAVLMDIQMPEMNGLQAARAIRALERPDAASVPIVAMTANTFKEDVDAAMDAGMNGFLPKPLDVDALYRLLHDLLRGGASR
ncbi:transporter substrate-binding domain-containing protein [Anaerofilum sp. BX8]|uniref:Circadian input-output histidine kinase CikA n=1 Tax=Anaerofilum hominis TaxID=2763016 RepID=A0A923L179_9FIRM|nr:transporter substrate-binding domain-containing protein [Anaerofilum hominis]MBC5580808.1 transporter substrate-binding domain-containing protein [Anaerofilum hominis]